MDIAYIANVRMPTEKAHGLQIAKMCEAFSNAGHTLTLIVPRRRNSVRENLYAYYGIERNFHLYTLWIPDPLVFARILGPVAYWMQSLLFLMRLYFVRPPKTTLIYTRNNPEIAHHYAKRGYRVVAEVHSYPQSKQKLFVRLLSGASLIVCNSAGTMEACNEAGLSRTVVGPNGIDPKDFSGDFDKKTVREELGIPADKKVVMYIGALDRWKGAETLLEASEKLSASAQVVIIGGDSPEELSILRARYPKALLLGPRPYRELGKNQAAADVLVVPNIPVSVESEKYTSPIKVFAHMASGVPIVASDLPSIREILSDSNAYFFKAGDSEALAHTITNVLGNPIAAGQRAVEAKKDGAKYTWGNRATTIMNTLAAQT